MEDINQVIVHESFKFSDGRIIAFLHSKEGKLAPSTFLKDDSGKIWQVQQYYLTTNSTEGYEKIRTEEAQNIFQYILIAIDHNDKPTKCSLLTTKS
jgi:hypothetical protein